MLAGAAVFGAATANGQSSPDPTGAYSQGGVYSFGNNLDNFQSMPGGAGLATPYRWLSQYSLSNAERCLLELMAGKEKYTPWG